MDESHICYQHNIFCCSCSINPISKSYVGDGSLYCLMQRHFTVRFYGRTVQSDCHSNGQFPPEISLHRLFRLVDEKVVSK
jgi:hypothetical protein